MKRTVDRFDLPSMTPGTRRSIMAHRYQGAGDGPNIYIQAGLHGNEHAGILVCHHLLRKLDRLAEQNAVLGRIILVPAVNPMGLSQFISGELAGRFDFYSNLNFNRDFPDLLKEVAAAVKEKLTGRGGHNLELIRGALTEALGARTESTEAAEMKRLIMFLAADADIFLDLHTDSQSLLHVYTHAACEHFGEDLAARLGAPLVLLGADRKARACDDSLNMLWSDLAEKFPGHPIPHGCRAATVELRGRIDVDDSLAESDAANLLNFLISRKAVAGLPEEHSATARAQVAPLTGLSFGTAPASGVAVFRKKPGEPVEDGEIVAEIVDPLAENPDGARHAVKSPCAGLLFSVSLVKLARRGQVIFKVAGRNERHDAEGALLTA